MAQEFASVLSDSLILFSLDIMGVIKSYLVYKLPSATNSFKYLKHISYPNCRRRIGTAYQITQGPDHNTWIARDNTLFVCNENGDIIRGVHWSNIRSFLFVDDHIWILCEDFLDKNVMELNKARISDPTRICDSMRVSSFRDIVYYSPHFFARHQGSISKLTIEWKTDETWTVSKLLSYVIPFDRLTINSHGEIHLFSLNKHHVDVYDTDFNHKRTLPIRGPRCIGFDNASNVLAYENSFKDTNTIDIYTPTGVKITTFHFHDLYYPQTICCDQFNRIWVADLQGHVRIFGFVDPNE